MAQLDRTIFTPATIDWDDPAAVSRVILRILPQRRPFRFVDRIVEVDTEHIVGEYRYREDEVFYPAHFPENPITPGVILIETMAQTAVVAFGIYLALFTERHNTGIDPSAYLTIFTDVQAEFDRPVCPGTQVIIRAQKTYWRCRKLRVSASLYLLSAAV